MSKVAKMAEDNTVLVVAILAVIASLAAAGFSYYSLSQGPSVSGFATSTGTANLTVESSLEINFTTTSINWQSGKVDTGKTYAVLDSEGTVFQGNWTAVNDPLVLENIGNVNVSLALQTGKTNQTFIGGTGPSYKWKVNDTVEPNSCGGRAIIMGTYFDVNQSAANTFCTQFGYLNTKDQIEIEINITVPYNSLTGALSDTITATASAA